MEIVHFLLIGVLLTSLLRAIVLLVIIATLKKAA